MDPCFPRPSPPRLPGVPSDLNHLLTLKPCSSGKSSQVSVTLSLPFPTLLGITLQNIHIVTQRTCECGALHGKGNFADVLKLKDLRWVIPEVHPNWELGEGLLGAVAKPGLNALVPRRWLGPYLGTWPWVPLESPACPGGYIIPDHHSLRTPLTPAGSSAPPPPAAPSYNEAPQ